MEKRKGENEYKKENLNYKNDLNKVKVNQNFIHSLNHEKPVIYFGEIENDGNDEEHLNNINSNYYIPNERNLDIKTESDIIQNKIKLQKENNKKNIDEFNKFDEIDELPENKKKIFSKNEKGETFYNLLEKKEKEEEIKPENKIKKDQNKKKKMRKRIRKKNPKQIRIKIIQLYAYL